MAKDLIRSKAFLSRNEKRDAIELVMDGEVVKIGVRQPTLKERNQILNAGGITTKGEVKSIDDATAMRIKAVTICAVDLESGERIFDGGDSDQFLAQPAGGWFDRLADRCLAQLHGGASIECGCGAILSAGAKFCSACGKPAPDPVEEAAKN